MPKKERLVKQAINGDQNALQTLLKEEKDKLYKIAFIYMKNEHDALEVFQQTILEVIESIHQLRNPAYFSTWATRICINVSLKERSEEHTSELQSRENIVCRLLLE